MENIEHTIKVAHLSDTHLGYQAYGAVSSSGRNQRSVDIATAFKQAIDQIIETDPPLVIHSGDLAERSKPDTVWMQIARIELTRLAGIRPDGTRRQVVVIGGNHDMPARHLDMCWLTHSLAGIPGLHLAESNPQRFRFEPELLNCDPDLSHVEVVAVPHEALKTLTREGWESVQPNEKTPISILAAHGVAGGSGLFRRSLGREWSIPTDLLVAGWDYVALGHWHRRGPIDGPAGSRAWYAGSTENMGFGDVRDNGDRRGWYEVSLNSEKLPKVESHDVHLRPMIRQNYNAGGQTPDEITAGLTAQTIKLRDAGKVDGAVVSIVISGVARDLRNLIDIATMRGICDTALHFEVSFKPIKVTSNDHEIDNQDSDVWEILQQRASATLEDVTKERQERAIELSTKLLKAEMKVSDENNEKEEL